MAGKDDVYAVKALFLQCVREVLSAHYTEKQVELWSLLGEMTEFWLERMEESWFLLCFEDGELAGFCVMQSDGNIEMLYTGAGFQGRGVARSLLMLAEAEARQRGLAWLVVDASTVARPAFERFGFNLVREQQTEAGGDPFINFKMVKDLD